MAKTFALDEDEKEPSTSWEDLRDDEYEDNLDEYGDGNQEAAWPDSDEEKESDSDLDDEEDEEESDESEM